MRKNILFFAALLLSVNLLSAQNSVQKVLLTEFTGTWCGYCPEGALIMDQILAANQNVFGVSIHNGDPMVTANGNYIQSFYTNSFPSGVINQSSEGISRNLWDAETQTQLQVGAPAAVSLENVSFDAGTRILTATVRASFSDPDVGKKRFNLFITEDHVSDATNSGYSQVNYFNGTAGHFFYGAGNPIVGFDHRHVMRYAAGGPWGVNNSIPTTVGAGEDYTWDFATYVSANYDETELYLVGVVSRFDGGLQYQRAIINSEELKLSLATGMDGNLSNEVQFLNIYPNPSQGRTSIAFNLKNSGRVRMSIHNMLGQEIAQLAAGHMASGGHTLYWDGNSKGSQPAAAGVYFIQLQTENGSIFTRKLVVSE